MKDQKFSNIIIFKKTDSYFKVLLIKGDVGWTFPKINKVKKEDVLKTILDELQLKYSISLSIISTKPLEEIEYSYETDGLSPIEFYAGIISLNNNVNGLNDNNNVKWVHSKYATRLLKDAKLKRGLMCANNWLFNSDQAVQFLTRNLEFMR